MQVLRLALYLDAWLTFAGAAVACGDDQGNAPTATVPGGTPAEDPANFLLSSAP